ncbi:RHS repeat-associated core domain-containing protein [Streptomyces melanogenes]|uniref:RHS repeat-associated core domain-containing protein n=1 Tax=Streptomyces melanogenes TaxID=67326 RepID=UPI001E493A48|nr:RHS repeat-associated core domain-containing protein [Streptomyces melanogenes]
MAVDADPLGRPMLGAPHSDKVSPFAAKVNKETEAVMKKAEAADREDAARARAEQGRTVTWPTAGSVTLTSGGKATATPGSLLLTLTRPGATKRQQVAAEAVGVRVLDQQQAAGLGVNGVVLSVQGPPTGGNAELGIDYGKFASAYGGDWAGRLQVVRLPDCALTSPSEAKCRTRTPLESTNHRGSNRLDAKLTFNSTPAKAKGVAAASGQTMVLALTAGTKSGSGDYKATPLAASSTWEAGGSSGTFTWSYPLRVPPAAAGPKPDLKISYDSGSVDGRTASTNNQGTAIGEGFDLTSSYIERKYGSCDDDGQSDKFDLCWKYDNASLVLNGKATELVKDDTSGKWRLKDDDASAVTRSTGAANGDDDGEYWTVVTGEGTKYVFGLSKLDGATDERTNSTWTVPVFGDDKDEPGYADGSAFADRWKRQAWRWNLDYVEDTHGNAMSYWYTAETNNYDLLGDDTTGNRYIRGGYLNEIRYGQRAGSLFKGAGGPAASDKVVFSYAERCLASGTGCDELTKDNRDNWPDVPFDAVCKDDGKCTGNAGPTFFTRKRMTAITAYAWNQAATTPDYAKVDSWSLTQRYLDPGDTGDATDQSLWLDQIRHTGQHGTDIALDPVKFGHEYYPNRVDGTTDDILPLNKPRLRTITSEAGAQTTVSYLPADCTAGQTKPKLDSNTKRCYPVYWSPNGGKDPILDWFQKYPVQAVTTTDPHGGSEPVEHSYSYSGGGAWHYNDDPLTKEKERTWSIWRGFGQVTHLTGASDHTQSKTVTAYLRGMNGDRVLGTDGKTIDPDKRKSVSVTGIKAEAIADDDQYAGFARETVTYNGAQEVGGQINDPWSKRTATQHKSYADIEAYYVRTGATHARTNITSSGTPKDRVRTTVTHYDDYGMSYMAEDQGDDAVTGDEKCTRTWYARNDDLGINSLVSRSRTFATRCGIPETRADLPTDPSRPGDVISDTATAYDDATTWTETQKPTKGEAKWTGRAKGYGADTQPSWQKVTTSDYDTLGRVTAVYDTNGLKNAATAYVPAAAGPLTSSAVSNAKGHTVTTAVDFATGAPTKVTDPNGKVTESEYDGLGRIAKVWLANRPRSLGKTPNYVYEYSVTAADLPWVSTATLKGDASGYNTTYEIYDAQLRPRQVQTPSPVSGRVISQTLYDDRGLAVSAQSDIWDAKNAPNSTLVATDGGQAPVETDTTYDGANRVINAVTKNHNITRWITKTNYSGDTVTTTVPKGGQATAVVTNALGQTVERREYSGSEASGASYTTTAFTYTPGGNQATITGPDKSRWSYDYDLYGRQTSSTDPDKGKSSTSYNELNQAVNTTDARGKTLLTEYDSLGRKTGLWDGTKTDATKLAAWTFDALAKGQGDTSERYENGINQATSKSYVQRATGYDNLYKVTGNSLTLPDSDPLVAAGVPKMLAFSTVYNLDGTVKQSGSPAVAGLASEVVSYTYGNLGQRLTSKGTTGYLQGALYSPLGDLRQLTLGTDPTAPKRAYLTYDYEDGTRRLAHSYVTDDVHSYKPQDLTFTQDDAGNVTSIFDSSAQGGTGKADNQCFAYDGQRRLVEAWTPKTADCVTGGRTATNIDGAAPYWTSYTYNDAGQRKTETQHATAGETTTAYEYGTAASQPHPLSRTTSGSKTSTYAYDKTGNTTSRPGVQGQQSLSWDSEGNLTSTSEPAAGNKPALANSYLYDANGALLIRRATGGDGETVLYLGSTEVRLTVKGSAKSLAATRSYTAGEQVIAVRTVNAATGVTKLSFLASDHHGTGTLALDATTLAVTKRYTAPFGGARGPASSAWPDDKTFLGKSSDQSTGLTHIGAREYDTNTGQFISVDPALELNKHQSLSGYAYAENNPATLSDPSGQGSFSCQMGVSCGEQATFIESHNAPDLPSGGTWESTYSDFPKRNDPPFLKAFAPMVDSPYLNTGSLREILSRPVFGIIDEGDYNGWETSRGLFLGWLWGGGYPLGSTQTFRGGDKFTEVLAGDETITKMRWKLLLQAVAHGMDAEGAKKDIAFSHQDKGPEPGSPWYKANSIRGAVSDVAGVLTNGKLGTSNYADAFLGTYSGTARIKSVDPKNGTVRIKFTATNLSDWNSATHVIPRSWNPLFEKQHGQAVTENFSWEENLPLDCRVE